MAGIGEETAVNPIVTSGIALATLSEIQSLFRYCDRVRYGAGTTSTAERQKSLARLRAVAQTLGI